MDLSAAEIINRLPYGHSFRFVDSLQQIDDDGVTGTYSFNPSLEFYKGHFLDHPVTPGVILTEVMAQIGLACLGIWLLRNEEQTNISIGMTSAETEFIIPVLPGETVTVVSEKIYFRFNKLKCAVTMCNENGKTVCKGTIAGMIIQKK